MDKHTPLNILICEYLRSNRKATREDLGVVFPNVASNTLNELWRLWSRGVYYPENYSLFSDQDFQGRQGGTVFDTWLGTTRNEDLLGWKADIATKQRGWRMLFKSGLETDIRKAVCFHCVECQGAHEHFADVKNCKDTECSLYPFRPVGYQKVRVQQNIPRAIICADGHVISDKD